MLPEERRSRIGALLLQKSSVSIAELAAAFHISEMTIRRDLDELAARGLCQRIHGGAMSLRTTENRGITYPAYFARVQAQAAEKIAIARRAAGLVNPGDTIAVDSGTTATYLAHALRGRDAITVISNSVQVLAQFHDLAGIVAISPGGILTVEDANAGGEWSFAGPITVGALRRFRPTRAFVTTSGITVEDGISNASLYQAEIKRTIIEIAEEVILIADHTKFGRANGLLVAPVSAFHRIITDSQTPAEDVAALRAAGVDVILVDPVSESTVPRPFTFPDLAFPLPVSGEGTGVPEASGL